MIRDEKGESERERGERGERERGDVLRQALWLQGDNSDFHYF